MEARLQAAIVDLDHAIGSFDSSADDVTIRRAVQSILTNLNRLREHRRRLLGGSYFEIEEQSSHGATTAALIMVRGFAEQDLLRAVVPEERRILPGETFPSEHLYPGSNLVWIPREELPFKMEHRNFKQNHEAGYDAYLAHQPVAGTFAIARAFLVEDAWLGSL